MFNKIKLNKLNELDFTYYRTLPKGYGRASEEVREFIMMLLTENETLRSDFKNQVEYTNKIAEENERKERLITQYGEGMCAYANRIDKAIEYINCNKQKTIGAYGDNEDDDFEICLWEEDINNLLNILQNGSEEE